MSSPPKPRRIHPVDGQKVLKTVDALRAYEEAHKTEQDPEPVSEGIWYEVAIANYLVEVFGPAGLRICLYPWGSLQDNRGKDALIYLPPPMFGYAVAVDFTTGGKEKEGLFFKVDRRWFSGKKWSLRVEPLNPIPKGKRTISAAEDVRMKFAQWIDKGARYLPRQNFEDCESVNRLQ